MTRTIQTLMAFVSFVAIGCQNASHTERGAGIGGLLGAGMGAAIGSASGDAGKGALIGAAAGGLLGGAAGNAEDKAERADLRAQRDAAAAAAAQPKLGITDVAGMATQGMSDQIIITQIRTTGSTYSLSPSDIAYLKQNNVSDGVIIAMQQATPQRVVVGQPPPSTVIIERPGYYGRPVYVAPPPVIGVGIGYSHHRHW